MKCQKCGKNIPDGKLFCENCGAEVQLVPDYNSVEYLLQYKKNEEQKQREETEKVIKELETEQMNAFSEKKKKKHPALIAVLILVGLAVLGVLIYIMIDYRNKNSFDYQFEKANVSFLEQDYEKSREYVERALYLEPDNVNAELLSVQIAMDTDLTEQAETALEGIIFNHPDQAEAYEMLIEILMQDQRVDEVKTLMDQCTEESIREKFSDYITEDPIFRTAEGAYKYKVKIEIEEIDEKVYYTIDGTNPTKDSTEYTEPVEMQEGKTIMKLIAYNEKGIPGNVVSRSFTITLARPNPPAISPASGTYEEGSKITVSVPAGCKAYYLFDGVASSTDKEYSEPVAMQSGEHIFSVILVDENGKQSYPASETYVLEDR